VASQVSVEASAAWPCPGGRAAVRSASGAARLCPYGADAIVSPPRPSSFLTWTDRSPPSERHGSGTRTVVRRTHGREPVRIRCRSGSIPSPGPRRRLFRAIRSGVCLGSIFAPSHKGMPVLTGEDRPDFLRRQVLTSRNVRGGRFTGLAPGGLNHEIERHLFPSMSSPNLRRDRRVVRRCREDLGVADLEAGLVTSYRQALRGLHEAGAPSRGAETTATAQPARPPPGWVPRAVRCPRPMPAVRWRRADAARRSCGRAPRGRRETWQRCSCAG
jgi:hypothetical protein